MMKFNLQRSVWLVLLVAVVMATPEKGASQYMARIDTTGFDSLWTKVAAKNPMLLTKKEEIAFSEEHLFQSKVSFLRNLKLGFQFNQATDATQNAIGIVPEFGFNIQLDFESIFTTPSKIRQAKIELRKSEQAYLSSRTNLKYELLRLFVEFKKAIESHHVQLEYFQAAQDKFSVAVEKFKNGEMALEDYTKAVDEKSKALEDLLRAELNVHAAKASLMKLVDN